LLPHEFEPQNATPGDEDYRLQGVSVDDLGDALAQAPALKRVLIFDTCYSGTLGQIAAKGNSPLAYRGAAERLSQAQGIYCLAATSGSELAVSHQELGHGVLTYALLAACGQIDKGPLQNVRLPAPPTGRNVDVLEWFQFAQRTVPGLYKQLAGRERSVTLTGDDQPGFSLLRVATPAPAQLSE
jgi:hypothetical protein